MGGSPGDATWKPEAVGVAWGCGCTLVEAPRDRLPHGGLLMGLGRIYVGFVPTYDR
jgi:hypothetical protein